MLNSLSPHAPKLSSSWHEWLWKNGERRFHTRLQSIHLAFLALLPQQF
jgi:hypothetical protein